MTISMRNACSIWPMHECTNDTAKTHYLHIKDGQKQWQYAEVQEELFHGSVVENWW